MQSADIPGSGKERKRVIERKGERVRAGGRAAAYDSKEAAADLPQCYPTRQSGSSRRVGSNFS
jgi:hypothetical protein